MKRAHYLYFFAFLTIFVFTFRSLLFNFSVNLFDWYDYPFAAWVINSGAKKLIDLDFVNLFNSNIFYPHTNTAFFTDLMLPQSIIGIPISLISNNPIIIFNFVFLMTFILNYVSVYTFWQTIFKNPLLSFLGSLFIIFSPYFFLEIGHFQMQSYWPFFFSLTLALKSFQNKNYRLGIFTGLACGIQFLASVYLGIFLLFAISLYTLIKFVCENKKPPTIKMYFLILLSFFFVSGVFIKGYLDTKNQYNITRSPNEFIQYSAHVSDYLFTSPIRSFVHTLPIMKAWNKFDKHAIGGKAAFPGFTLFILAILGILSIKVSKKQVGFGCNLNNQSLFFMSLIFFGMVFSWGPRINFNGNYASIPSPYYIFLKYIPFLESARAPSRWSFLFYIGIAYFALLTIQKTLKRKNARLMISIIFIIFLLEYIPFRIDTHGEEYTNSGYETLQSLCKNNKMILLEVPITHFDGNGGIVDGLNRVTKYELSSLIHNCHLKNGYSGYDSPSLLSFKNQFYEILKDGNSQLLINFLSDNHIDVLKINVDKLSKADFENYKTTYPSITKLKTVREIDQNLFLINN